MSIEWTKPEIFGIKWDNGPNQPASPLTEISHSEFTRLMHCGPWGLEGLNYGGSAPLPGTTKNKLAFLHGIIISSTEKLSL